MMTLTLSTSMALTTQANGQKEMRLERIVNSCNKVVYCVSRMTNHNCNQVAHCASSDRWLLLVTNWVACLPECNCWTHNGGFTGTVLRITTELQGGGWAAACGVLADSNSVRILFDIIDLRLGESREDHLVYVADQGIDYSIWYQITIRIDENAEGIACLLDGQIVGEYELPNTQELAVALVNREIGVWHEADAEATILVDNVSTR